MILKAQEMTLDTGRWYPTNNTTTINTADVTRWGKHITHGRNGARLVAEYLGSVVSVTVSKLPKEQQKDLLALQKCMEIDGMAMASIKACKTIGIVWDTSGVYIP